IKIDIECAYYFKIITTSSNENKYSVDYLHKNTTSIFLLYTTFITKRQRAQLRYIDNMFSILENYNEGNYMQNLQMKEEKSWLVCLMILMRIIWHSMEYIKDITERHKGGLIYLEYIKLRTEDYFALMGAWSPLTEAGNFIDGREYTKLVLIGNLEEDRKQQIGIDLCFWICGPHYSLYKLQMTPFCHVEACLVLRIEMQHFHMFTFFIKRRKNKMKIGALMNLMYNPIPEITLIDRLARLGSKRHGDRAAVPSAQAGSSEEVQVAIFLATTSQQEIKKKVISILRDAEKRAL
ncbi:hypothetical protein ACJX0J_020086, partial [Zea mays]